MDTSMRSIIPATVCALMLAACSTGTGQSTDFGTDPSTTADPTATPSSSATVAAPFHAIPADAVAVAGTAACDLSEDGVDPEGGPGFLAVCELRMSDPRVSGTERDDRFRDFAEGPGGRVWVAEEVVITNTQGTWRGSTQAAENQQGIASGEAHFIGEGAYEGLEFHYYFFHADLSDVAQLRGWISGNV